MLDALKIVIAVGAFSGVVASVVTVGFSWLRELLAKKREAAYLAMRLAVLLEGYAMACIGYASFANEHWKQYYGEPPDDVPQLPPYPSDADWKALDQKLADQILSFANEIATRARSARFARIFEGNAFQIQTEIEESAHRAIDLAGALRKRYGFAPSEPLRACLKKEARSF